MSDAESRVDRERADAVAAWFSGSPRGPFSLEISPTMACNVNCRFCRRKDELPDYYSRAKDVLDNRWFEVISEAVTMGARRLFFRGGGDPSLKRSLLRRLFPLIRRHDVSCTLLTNGTLIDDAMAEGFVSSGWQEIIVSLHGGDAATHDYITDQPGSFAAVEKSLQALNRAKEARRSATPLLSFHAVVTRRSYRSLDLIIEFAQRHRCRNIGFFPMHNPPYERYTTELVMTAQDRAAYQGLLPGYRRQLEALGITHDFQLSYQGDGEVEPLVAQVLPQSANAGAEGRIATAPRPLAALPCYFPWYHATLTPNGFVSPCCYGEGKQNQAELSRVSFKDAWFGYDMAEVRARMLDGRMMPYCEKCPNWYQQYNQRLRDLFSREPAR